MGSSGCAQSGAVQLTVTVLLLAPLAALHTAGQETPVAGKAALDICSFGATGDGKTLNTAAIQKAIDACHAAGGVCTEKPKPASANFSDYSSHLAEVVLLGNVAIRTGTKLQWDGGNLRAMNCPAAEQYIRREYRKGRDV